MTPYVVFEYTASNYSYVKYKIWIPYASLDSYQQETRIADRLAEMKDGVQIIDSYTQFLWKRGLEAHEKTKKLFK